jgi:hypothetical protein
LIDHVAGQQQHELVHQFIVRWMPTPRFELRA